MHTACVICLFVAHCIVCWYLYKIFIEDCELSWQLQGVVYEMQNLANAAVKELEVPAALQQMLQVCNLHYIYEDPNSWHFAPSC